MGRRLGWAWEALHATAAGALQDLPALAAEAAAEEAPHRHCSEPRSHDHVTFYITVWVKSLLARRKAPDFGAQFGAPCSCGAFARPAAGVFECLGGGGGRAKAPAAVEAPLKA